MNEIQKENAELKSENLKMKSENEQLARLFEKVRYMQL